MAHYAIGDVQGCYHSLMALLETIRFDPVHDRLFFLGDLVNRGAGSLETLRHVAGLGSAATSVLGNHDLHLLGCVAGTRKVKPGDTLQPILDAPDRDRLIDWLRRRPFVLEHGQWIMVHAGILPGRKWKKVMRQASRLEAGLLGRDWTRTMARWRGPVPDRWGAARGVARDRLAVGMFTRLRCVDRKGRPLFGYKGPPEHAPVGEIPWYMARRPPKGRRWLFGHWAALDFCRVPRGYALDSGCVWGRRLTALRLQDEAVYQVPMHPADRAQR